MWAYECTFYQIYPLGMCGAPHENDGVPAARLRRIIDWVPFFKRLGVGAVLLNPVFESSTHGYDTRDFFHVDTRLGTNDDLVAVVRALHEQGIRVLLDAVFNHVGREFWAFQDARQKGRESRYRDWFIINFDGDSSYGDGFWYEGWEGHFELVKLNLRNPEVIEYLLGCVRTWRSEFGIDGLRLDVAYSLDDDFVYQLRSLANELSQHPASDVPGDATFVLIGEILHGDYSQLANERKLHSCTNYECYKGLYSSLNAHNMFEIAHSLHRQFGSDPWCVYQGLHLLSFADNHDVTRLASRLENPAHLQPAYGVLFGMPGIPCLYYGSEWGIEGEKGATDDWALRPPLEEPAPNDLAAWIERLIAVRAAHDEDGCLLPGARALCYGGYRNVCIASEQLVFERAVDADGDAPAARVLVAVNSAGTSAAVASPDLAGTFTDLLANGAPTVELAGSLELAPCETRYLLAS